MAEYEYKYIYSKIRPGRPWVDQIVVPGRQDRLNNNANNNNNNALLNNAQLSVFYLFVSLCARSPWKSHDL